MTVRTADRKRIVVVVLLIIDVIMLSAASLGATYIKFHTLSAIVAFENVTVRIPYYDLTLFTVAISIICLWLYGVYEADRLFWGNGEFSRVFTAIGMSAATFVLITYALKVPGLSRAWTMIAFALSVTLVAAGRLTVRSVLRAVRSRGYLSRRTLIVGSNAEAAQIIQLLQGAPETGLVPVGFLALRDVDCSDLDSYATHVPCLGETADLTTIVRGEKIDTVLIVSSAFGHNEVSGMIAELRGVDVTTQVSSGLFEILTRRVFVRDLAGVPLITVRGISLSPGNLLAKRAFDLVVAGIGVLVGLPVWLILALAIKLESRGPVLYKQRRVGRHGTPFGMYKFRSMHDGAEARLSEVMADNEATGPLFKMKNDPRVTRVGVWMRKFSIDEFPQLLNVLRGEMSLVGPRPPLPEETAQYTPEHWRRMEVPPGMTGLWQVSGRSWLTFDEMVRLDLYYIENWSIGFDMSLIIRTLPAVLFARGAY